MATLTIRNVPEEIHRAIRIRAAHTGRSTEAEVRAILELAVQASQSLKLGDALMQIAQSHGLLDEDVSALEASFRRPSATPMHLE